MLLEEPWNVPVWTRQLNGLLETNDVGKIREYYRLLVTAFPTSSLIWYSWMQYEWRNSQYEELEKLFTEALRPHGDVRMWKLYIKYVRLCNAQVEGEEQDSILAKRQTIMKVYELALSHVGLDLYSGIFYQEYVKFIQSWKCSNLYEQQVQMDQIRKVYNRALSTPVDLIESLWHDYDAYENSLNKLTAKKFLADKSPTYMTARAVVKELKEILSSINREEYALPPGDPALAASKVATWQRYIEWEQANPLNLPEKSTVWFQRLQYAYKSCLACLRQYGEIWFYFTKWLLVNGKKEEAEAQFKSAIEILPTDLMVVFSYCDFLESTSEGENSKAPEARVHYETLIETLQKQIEASIVIPNETSTSSNLTTTSTSVSLSPPASLVNSLTLAYIQFMNYIRRVEGINAARAIFTRARKFPHLSHQIYLSAAKMEYFCKKDVVIAGKIFELGMSKFSTQAEYVLEYLQHLINVNDEQNIRALFERAILCLTSEGGLLEVWKIYLDYIFRYGDLVSIRLMTKRFQEAFPGHVVTKEMTTFCRQYSYEDLDVASERIWSNVQGNTLDIPQASIIEERKISLLKPFFIPDTINDIIDILPSPSVYNGPNINAEGMVKLLQVVRLIPDAMTAPMVPVSVTRLASRKTPTDRTDRNRTGPKRRHRLDDGDARPEAVQAVIREDDIFAHRRRT